MSRHILITVAKNTTAKMAVKRNNSQSVLLHGTAAMRPLQTSVIQSTPRPRVSRKHCVVSTGLLPLQGEGTDYGGSDFF